MLHEEPNSFRWKVVPGGNAVLEEGMITSDEPGYDVEDGGRNPPMRHDDRMQKSRKDTVRPVYVL